MCRSHAPTRIAPPRAIATLVAVLALLLQGFAVQTHVHAFSPAVYEQSAASAAQSDTARVEAADQAACVVCQALANAGRAALPQAPALLASFSANNETAALAIKRAPRALTHSWQSRAPPIAL